MAKRDQSRLKRPTAKLAYHGADPTAADYPSGEAPVMPTGHKSRRRRRPHPNSTAATVWNTTTWSFRAPPRT